MSSVQRKKLRREALKLDALRLFAERGIDGVSVRDIAAAAGQKNHGAVSYYFESKEALVREIVTDGASIIEEKRNSMLDEMEARGGPSAIREVMNAMIYPSLEPYKGTEYDCWLRFTVMLNMTHRDIFRSAIGDQGNRGYQRCLAHLRRLMPPISMAEKNQRLMLLGSYISIILATRQTAMADTARDHKAWLSESTVRQLAHTATAMLSDPQEEEAFVEEPASWGGLMT
jgi:AcrR family transcriptional regulator